MCLRVFIALATAFGGAAAFIGCGGGGITQSSSPPVTPVSSGYFPYQQGWLGADGAYSIPIGTGQSLWILADTFVGPASATSRTQANGLIHNSIAISNCTGSNCSFQYY